MELTTTKAILNMILTPPMYFFSPLIERSDSDTFIYQIITTKHAIPRLNIAIAAWYSLTWYRDDFGRSISLPTPSPRKIPIKLEIIVRRDDNDLELST